MRLLLLFIRATVLCCAAWLVGKLIVAAVSATAGDQELMIAHGKSFAHIAQPPTQCAWPAFSIMHGVSH